MRKKDADRLLHEVLSASELDTLRQATLKAGLDGMRRRRRSRRVVQNCAVVGLVFLAVLIGHHWIQIEPLTNPVTVTGAKLASSPNNTKVISDEELFALFPGRSVALIGKPGHQQLVFLDEPASQQSQ